jgi:hypothetical protein
MSDSEYPAVEIIEPFAAGSEKEITATGSFHWADNEFAPKSGYFARVSHSTISADGASVPTELELKMSLGQFQLV